MIFGVLCMVKENNLICPYCEGQLKHYDKVLRIVKSAGGTTKWIYINRAKCDICNRKMTGYHFPDYRIFMGY